MRHWEYRLHAPLRQSQKGPMQPPARFFAYPKFILRHQRCRITKGRGATSNVVCHILSNTAIPHDAICIYASYRQYLRLL